MKIRKQIDELTLDDLHRFPIWEYALDEEDVEEQDETTVRPCDVSGVLDPSDGMYIVKAAFTFADGSKMLGYLNTPFEGDNNLSTLQPVIITATGQVGFWYGAIFPTAEELKQSYQLLDRDVKQVFPIQFNSVVELSGGPVSGSLEGFLFLEDWETGEVKIIQ